MASSSATTTPKQESPSGGFGQFKPLGSTTPKQESPSGGFGQFKPLGSTTSQQESPSGGFGQFKPLGSTTTQQTFSVTKKEEDETFAQFYSEVKEIEKRDSVLTPEQQINRLLRPGATYFNLNPFEVLQIDSATPFEEIAKHYRRLSMLVHPDKNPSMPERASLAFEAINKAYKMLEDETERKKCLEVVEEARDRVEKMVEEKRLKYKNQPIEEDAPDGYKKALWSVTCKLFADIERLRVREEANKAEERKRKAEETTEREERTKLRKEWDKNYEESRETRVNSWKSFQTVAKTKDSAKGKTPTLFKPPKSKPEGR